MENHQYGLTSITSIRTFLEFWPKFSANFEDAWLSLSNEEELCFGKNAIKFSWCHLYELPVKEHIEKHLTGIMQDENLLTIYKDLKASKDQIAYIPKMANQVDSYFDALEPPSKEEAIELMPVIAAFFGSSLSVFHSLRCVLYHGCFLNELVERVRTGDDKALFDAIRLDPTVIGCKAVIERISKAALLQDNDFFSDLKRALNGKATKREQANYQKMRLVFEILHEAKSEKLNDDQLYELFVKSLNLYSWNEREGGNAKALRKFADTYMKKTSTT